MLSRFTTYILIEVIKLFIVALVGLTLVVILGTVVQQMITEGLGWLAILRLLPYATVYALQYTVSATFLFAVCSVYGRMSADNELVAIRSVGISPWRIMTPILLFGMLLSPFAVWLNDLAYSWAKPGMSRVILHSIEEIAYQALRSRKSYISQAFAINVQDVQDKWLIHPTIIVYNQERGPSRTIFSERARLSMNLEEETLEFELIDSEGNIGTHSLSWVGPAKFAFSLDRASRKGIEKNSPGQFALRDLGAEIRRQDEKNSKTRDAMAALCSMAMATGRFQLFDEPPLEELQRKLKDGSKRSLQLVTEPWKRWSLGFSCFLFVWVGAPLAIWMRSADNWTTFGVCFLPILLLYYPLYALGLEQAKAGHWPAYSLWIANLVWFVIGLFLIRRVCRN